jgi:CHAT domain-containing protein
MKVKRRSKKYSIWEVTLVSAIAILCFIPPVAAQTNPPSSDQSAELAEAERLEQQISQLNIQGKQSEAISLAQRALTIYEQMLGQEHFKVANSLDTLADLYLSQKNYSQAEPLYQRALSIREKRLKQLPLGVVSSLNTLAGLYKEQGKYSAAEPLLQRSLYIYAKVLGQDDSPELVPSLGNLARIYHAQGKYTQAERLYQRTLAIGEKLGRSHPFVVGSLNNLSLLYLNQGNIPRAVKFLERANNIEEQKLAVLLTDGSESQKRAYITNLVGATEATVSLHVQEAPTSPQAARLALTTILRRKSRVLDALTNSLQALRVRSNPEDRALLDELALVRSELAAKTFTGAGSNSPDHFRRITILTEQEQKLESAISRRSAEFRSQNQPITIESVQKLIPSDAALVEFVLYKPYKFEAIRQGDRFYRSGTPRYVAYILFNQGEPKWVELGDAETINEAVSEFRRTIRIKSGSQRSFIKAARHLDTKLMQPIRKQLGNQHHILLSPDSQLNLIPFAALIDEKNQYLIKNYQITYVSSGQDLIRLQADLPSKQNPVIIANLQFDKPGNSPTVRVASNTRGIDNQNSTDLASLKYGSIEGTATEAKVISTILPNVKLLTGSEATENAIKQLNAPNILHIATHGFFLLDAPPSNEGKAPDTNFNNPLLRSGLALSGFNLRKSGNEDGVLTALEVAGLNLAGTKLVVLSACETGLGDIANGEGVYGLRRALAIAGAESQLITLWLVDDEATKDLMINYYGRLQKNVGRSRALRQTQLEMLKNPQYQRPYYWAAFIPSGNWARLKVRP